MWRHRSSPQPVAAGFRLFLPIAVRACSWAAVAVALIVATLHFVFPSVSMSIGEVVLAVLLLPGLLLLVPVFGALPGHQLQYRLDETGLRADRSWRFRWHGAVGYALVGEPEPALFLVGRAGRPYVLPLPTEPHRADVLDAVQSRLRTLSSIEHALYRVPVTLTAIEVVGITLIAYINALVVASVFPTLLRGLSSALFAIIALGALCLPTSIAATIRYSRRYPQFRFGRAWIALCAWFFALGQAVIYSMAFVVRTLVTLPRSRGQ
jgi:hypothetical protein